MYPVAQQALAAFEGLAGKDRSASSILPCGSITRAKGTSQLQRLVIAGVGLAS
jgi:hypothetical protein